MLDFPKTPDRPEPPLPKMTLQEYAHFSEQCLRSNPAITPQNCLTKRNDEATMQPFRMPSPESTGSRMLKTPD